MTISRGLSIESPLQNRRAANAKQRGHEPGAEYEKRDRQGRHARPASEFAQFAAEYERATSDHQSDQRNGKGNRAGERLRYAVKGRFPRQPTAAAAREGGRCSKQQQHQEHRSASKTISLNHH